jgi:hypothetical protein
MYLLDPDVKQLCQMLDADPEIALVVRDGATRWKAQRHVPKLKNGEHALWHIPSGPIELESDDVKEKPKIVKNPFAGWSPRVPRFERESGGVPWFGPGPLGIIRLMVRRTAGPGARDYIGLSEFAWIGRYYSTLGYKPAKSTEQWWSDLRRRVAKIAVHIPTEGPLTGKYKAVWAFPAALAAIKRGQKRADNPTPF